MRRQLSPRACEALVALKTETQLLELAVLNFADAMSGTAHALRLFRDACLTANAASGGTLFPALRDQA